jgi:hypothetical protein
MATPLHPKRARDVGDDDRDHSAKLPRVDTLVDVDAVQPAAASSSIDVASGSLALSSSGATLVSSKTCHLNRLSAVEQQSVMHFLPTDDLLALVRTCRQLYASADQRHVWKQRVMELDLDPHALDRLQRQPLPSDDRFPPASSSRRSLLRHRDVHVIVHGFVVAHRDSEGSEQVSAPSFIDYIQSIPLLTGITVDPAVALIGAMLSSDTVWNLRTLRFSSVRTQSHEWSVRACIEAISRSDRLPALTALDFDDCSPWPLAALLQISHLQVLRVSDTTAAR